RQTDFSPRLDYQINPRHTLSSRYGFTRTSGENYGVGEFSLASRAVKVANTEHFVRLTETAILSARVVNEARFQFIHARRRQAGDDALPALNVQEAFL